MVKYNKEIVKRCQDYFEKRSGVKMSDEEANSALDSLSDLFLIFADLVNTDNKINNNEPNNSRTK